MTQSISLTTLWKNYPTPAEFTHDQLFDELGWSDLKGNTTYANTCAIRMSLCLIRSGVTIPGRLQILKGDHKGKWIEPGQKRLSVNLKSEDLFGSPTKLKLKDRGKELNNRKGIVSFMSIPGYVIDGALSGHIDLVKSGKFLWFWDTYECAESCYWDAKEFWFWPLS